MSADTRPTLGGLIDEDARKRFEAVWRGGRPEPIERFLPAEDSRLYQATLEELVPIDMEFRWKTALSAGDTLNGPPPRVEDYLARFPRLNQPEIVRRLLKEEFGCRRRHGGRPNLAEYQARFPQLGISDTDLDATFPTEERLPPAPPELPGYEILNLLGRGGMGLVYKAQQISLRRVVAIKQILAGAAASPDQLTRFRKEAETIARLQHPNIVQVYEVSLAGGVPYIALEFVDGGTLDRKLAGTPLPAREAAQLARMLARAMQAVHERGILHRDLKPSNVLLTSDGTPKISDFGLAKQFQTEPSDTLGAVPDALTQTGAIVGTPCYMAPEQAAGRTQAIGPAADIYALGAMLYEMLTGRPPFKGATPTDTLYQVLHDEVVAPRRLQPRVPRDLETICLKCLDKDPSGRYASAGDLASDLERFGEGKPITARPVGRIERVWRWCRRKPAQAALVAALLLLLVGSVAGLFIWQHADFEREQQVLDFQHQQERQRLDAQSRQQIEVQRRLDALRGGIEINRAQARGELQTSRFASALKFLQQALDIAREPGLDDLRARVLAEQDRVARLVAFYQLSDRAERQAFLDNDQLALQTSEEALKRLGVFENPKAWWTLLPTDGLTPEQITALHNDVNHLLIVLAGMWTREGFTNNREEELEISKQCYRNGLDTLRMVSAFHEAQGRPMPMAAESLRAMCQFKVNGLFGVQLPKAKEPNSGSDYYFIGMVNLAMSHQNDELGKVLREAAAQFGFKQDNYRLTAELWLRRATSAAPRHYWSHHWQGWSLSQGGDYMGAELAFTTCVALRPDYALGYAERANVLAIQHEVLQKYIHTQLDQLKLDPAVRESLRKECEMRCKVIEPRCLADVAKATQLDPLDWHVRSLCCFACARLNRRPEAMTAAAAVLALTPMMQMPASRRHQMPADYLMVMDGFLSIVVQTDPANAEAWSMLAFLRLHQPHMDADALRNAAHALELTVAHPKEVGARERALVVLGILAMRQNEMGKARWLFQAILSRNPGHFLAKSSLAQALEIHSDWEQALRCYQDLGRIAVVDWQRLEALLGQARTLYQLGRLADVRSVLAQAEPLDRRASTALAKTLFPKG